MNLPLSREILPGPDQKQGVVNEHWRAIAFAAGYADNAHIGQTRKGNGRPYITHPAAVYDLVIAETERAGYSIFDQVEAGQAAWLHDVIEDTGSNFGDILGTFGPGVAMLVLGLTSLSKLACPTVDRETRKRVDREFIKGQPRLVQLIKLCDIIHNASEIDDCGKEFADRWRAEKRSMLCHMMGGELWQRAWKATQIA